MLKQSKQIIVDAILMEIEQGIDRGKCLAKIVKKWQISSRTFDRYWKTANQQQQERQHKASEAADIAYVQSKVEAAKEAVMSKQERLEFLSKIVKANTDIKTIAKIPMCILIQEDGSKQVITLKDKLTAIAEMNKMEGDYAPTKTELSGKNGAELFKNQSDEDLKNSLAEILKKLD